MEARCVLMGIILGLGSVGKWERRAWHLGKHEEDAIDGGKEEKDRKACLREIGRAHV